MSRIEKITGREILDSRAYPTVEATVILENGGCGTAAVVSPIGELCYKGAKYTINNGEIGAVTQHLYDTLTGIQFGKIEDPMGWVVKV